MYSHSSAIILLCGTSCHLMWYLAAHSYHLDLLHTQAASGFAWPELVYQARACLRSMVLTEKMAG